MSNIDSKETLGHGKKESQSLFAKSAQGATFLICLQVGSRALTFIVNQILLRYLSPELMGISTQLELYSISVLYFARESLRVALQRQTGDATISDGESRAVLEKEEDEIQKGAQSRVHARRAQEVINLSYVAIALGVPLAYLLARLYIRKAEHAVLVTPYIHESLNLYALAALIELLSEPCFVIGQQQMLYGVRASAETSATFTRCIVTCSLAIYSSRSRQDLGALPFAIGQFGYATVLNMVYYSRVWSKAYNAGSSMLPRPLSSNSSQYILSRFSRPILTLSLNLYAQSGLKHLLTQGDSVLIALFTSLSSQGVYALASNYGSLLARMLFQPIEESSRGVFGRLLAPSNIPDPSHPTPASSATKANSQTPPPSVLSAHTYLTTILHLYSLLSTFILCIGPTLSPLLLRYIAGPQWSASSAGAVLGLYCYYIPLLATNGILEAFVSSVATPSQLRRQSLWMFAFSAGFAGSGYVALSVYDLGAKGLVLANAVNMGMRILWSWAFVKGYFQAQGVDLAVRGVLPSVGTVAVGIGVASYLGVLSEFRGSLGDVVKTGAVGGLYGLVLLFFERDFLRQCYRMLRPPSTPDTARLEGEKESLG